MIPLDHAPRLRPDVFLVPSGRGTAYVRSSHGTDLIAAPGIAAWLDRLAPFLDGTRTVGQLIEGLDDTRRPVVLGVLDRLDAHGLLQDAADPGPAERASAYSALRVLLLAPPSCGPALADALRLTGTGPTTVVTDPAEAEAAAGSGRYDALLLLAAAADPGRVSRLDELCRRHGLWFATAVGDAEAWWIGPVLAPGPTRAEGGWLGAWLRLHGTAPAAATVPVPAPRAADCPAPREIPDPPEGSRTPDGVAAAAGFDPADSVEVAASLLAHHFHQALTADPRTAEADRLVRLDPAALTTSRHRYRPHPAALAAAPETEAEFRAKIEALRAGPVVGLEEFSQRAADNVDPRAGLIADLDEGGLPQFPRRASTALLRDPAAAGTEHRVYGVGPDFTSARVRTARRALEVYGRLAADPRRYTPTPAGPAVWAWSPETGAVRLVPAAAVYGRGRPAPRGLGSGATLAEAVAAARRDLRGAAEGRTANHTTLIVPLDHDPAATRILPYLVRAVVHTAAARTAAETPLQTAAKAVTADD